MRNALPSANHLGHCEPWTCWSGRRLLMKLGRRLLVHRGALRFFVKVPTGSAFWRKKRCESCGKESRLRACKHIICHGVKSLCALRKTLKVKVSCTKNTKCCAWVILPHFILRYLYRFAVTSQTVGSQKFSGRRCHVHRTLPETTPSVHIRGYGPVSLTWFFVSQNSMTHWKPDLPFHPGARTRWVSTK